MFRGKIDKISEIYRPIIKVVISLIVLGVIKAILIKLPGLEVPIPWLPFRLSAVITGVIATIAIIIVLRFGYEIYPTLKSFFPTFPEVAGVLLNIIYLLAIGIAYASFRGIAYPSLHGTTWVYPLIFLAIAILPTIRIVTTLLGNVDKWTDLIYKKAREISGEFISCPNCGEKIAKGSQFCTYCGTKIEEAKVPRVGVKHCPACGSEVESDAKFCAKCGKEIK